MVTLNASAAAAAASGIRLVVLVSFSVHSLYVDGCRDEQLADDAEEAIKNWIWRKRSWNHNRQSVKLKISDLEF